MRKNEKWRTIPVVVKTAKDITPVGPLRLNGCVGKILQKETCASVELLAAVRELVVAVVDQEADTGG